MKDKRNKLLVAGILLVAAIFGFHMLSLVQEPPHIVHTYAHYGSVVAPYYNQNDWYPSNINIISPQFSGVGDWGNVYKVRVDANIKSLTEDNGNVYFMLNPDCTASATDHGTTYSCDGNYAKLGYVQGGIGYAPASASVSHDGSGSVSVGFYSVIDRGKSAKANDIIISIYEQVECTEDSHCVSAAPVCNTVTNRCETVITPPDTPPPSGFMVILQDIWDWLVDMFNSLIYMSIVGQAEDLQPGDTYTYQIDLTASEPDKEYQDGTYQTQYGYWALVTSGGTVIDGQTDGVEVNGLYSATPTITLPDDITNYILIGTVTQIDSVYDISQKVWVHGDEYVVVKEAIDLNTAAPIPDIPSASGFMQFLSGLWDWLSGLFR